MRFIRTQPGFLWVFTLKSCFFASLSEVGPFSKGSLSGVCGGGRIMILPAIIPLAGTCGV